MITSRRMKNGIRIYENWNNIKFEKRHDLKQSKEGNKNKLKTSHYKNDSSQSKNLVYWDVCSVYSYLSSSIINVIKISKTYYVITWKDYFYKPCNDYLFWTQYVPKLADRVMLIFLLVFNRKWKYL